MKIKPNYRFECVLLAYFKLFNQYKMRLIHGVYTQIIRSKSILSKNSNFY
jgi:hypothetical protein